MWFLKPKHTLQTVAKKILDGLEDGSIVLDNERDVSEPTPPGTDVDQAWVAAPDGPRSVPNSNSPRLVSHTRDDE